MMTVTVRIPTPLRSFADGAEEVVVKGDTVGDILTELGKTHDGLTDRILTPEGEVRQFVMVYLGKDDIRTLDGLDTAVSEGDILSIIPAVAGGKR